MILPMTVSSTAELFAGQPKYRPRGRQDWPTTLLGGPAEPVRIATLRAPEILRAPLTQAPALLELLTKFAGDPSVVGVIRSYFREPLAQLERDFQVASPIGSRGS